MELSSSQTPSSAEAGNRQPMPFKDKLVIGLIILIAIAIVVASCILIF